MTNYEYLKMMIDNKFEVGQIFCHMIEREFPDDYCDEHCPFDRKCRRGQGGIDNWLDEERKSKYDET